VTAAGRAFLKEKTADFGAQFKLKNTKGLQELVPHIPDGTCSIAVRGSTDLNKGIAHVHLKGDAAKLSSSSAIVNEAMGSKPHFQTDLVLDAEHILLKNFSMQGRHALWDGEADYSRSSEEYGATCKGTIRKLDAFSTALEIPLAGSVKLDGSIKGDSRRTEYQVLLTSEILEICGQNLNELNIQSSFTQSPKFRGETRATFELGESSLKSRARFEFIDNGLRISELNIEGFNSSLNGLLVLNWIGSVPVIDGTVRLKCRDLSLPASYFDTTLSGSADAELSLQAFDGIQSAKLQMAGTKLKLKLPDSPSIRVDDLETTLSSSHLRSQELTEFNLNVSGFNRTDLALDTAKISVRKGNDSFSIEASAVGDWQKQKANFALAGAFSEKNIRLSELKGMFREIPIELQNPASLTTDTSFLDFEETDFRSSNWDLKVGLGRLKGQIDKKGENISSTLSVAAIEIQPLLPAELSHIEGLVSGSIALSGTTTSPNLKAELEVQDLTSSEIGPKELSIRPTLSFELREQRLRGKLGLLDQSENLISASRVECKFSVPVHVRLAPMVFGLDPDSQISIGVSSNVDIARLDQLLLVDEHSLNGKAKLDFSLEGSFNQPRWSADASVTDGTYTNAITGTSFQSIVMEMTGTDSKMVIKASATDGGLGSLRMEGWLIPSLARSFAHAFRLELKNAHLVRVDSLALAANGDLSLEGDMRRHRLNGELTISPGELVIPGSSGEEIAEIAITEVNGPADQMPDKPSVKSSLPEVDLDINVNVPGRVYVRGRGLTSEWKGGLSVSGTTDSPTVTGKLSILRGHFVFAGKRFGIRSGSLVFAGNKPPSPNLDIEAETETGGITAGLRLFGPVTSPQLELKSIPELPRDEILARILFGKQLASISALQALRLASAIKTLAGGGSAFDLSAKLRRFTGVDQIELRKGENESMGQGRVAVGKYVVEGVYVEVEKGLRTNQDKVTVEVDITPNISAETELDAKGGRGVGLNWKWDY
jgi:translocation and assembly module TamB